LGAGETAPKKTEKVAGAEKSGGAKTAEPAQPVSVKPAASAAPTTSSGRVKASPLAKKIAAAKGVQLATIQGSGPGGRVVAKDLESAAAQTPRATASAPAPILPGPLPEGAKRIPLSGMRKI